MQRWSLALFGVLVVGFLAVVVLEAGPVPEEQRAPATPEAGAIVPDAGADALDQKGNGDAGHPSNTPAASPVTSPVPELPDDAPKRVSFGVILFTYRGAQGAPEAARSKQEALAKAKELLDEATASFDDAVKKGDPGSRADAGRIPRGVLEKDVEYILFTMEKGAVYERPLDTPRGYWILRRND